MTTDGHQRNPRSDAPLEGRAALDLYLTELGRSVAAITEQSVVLLRALSERVTLMREIERQRPPSQPDQAATGDVTPPASPGPSPGPKP